MLQKQLLVIVWMMRSKIELFFVVSEGKMGLAIGKGGSNIKSLQNILKRNVELDRIL